MIPQIAKQGLPLALSYDTDMLGSSIVAGIPDSLIFQISVSSLRRVRLPTRERKETLESAFRLRGESVDRPTFESATYGEPL